MMKQYSYSAVLAASFALGWGGGALGQVTHERLHLTNEAGQAQDYFGHAVDTNGQVVIVGAYQNDLAGTDAGAAYLYDFQTGQLLHTLIMSNAAEGDQAGYSVAIGEVFAAVGVWGADDLGDRSGAVCVFDIASGDEVYRLTASDGEARASLGWSLAIDGSRLLVGAPHPFHWGQGEGTAYLFDLDTGAELRKITSSEAEWFDMFGFSVAMDGDRAVIGAIGDDDGGNNAGAAYLVDLTGGVQVTKLTAHDATVESLFGWSSAVCDDTVLVAAPSSGDLDLGSVYRFEPNTGNYLSDWVPIASSEVRNFGYSLSCDGVIAAVGAFYGPTAGAAYAVDVATSQVVAQFGPSDLSFADRFGVDIAIHGGEVVVGDWQADIVDVNAGAAFVFDLPVEPCVADLNGSGQVDLADLNIVLAAFGSGTSGDVNGDGVTDLTDLNLVLAAFGTAC